MATSSTQSPLPFTTWIDPLVLEKLNMYAAEAVIQNGSEIGGFIKVEEEGQDVFVNDIFIPVQQATGGTFDVSAEMDGEFMRWMMKNGRRAELPLWKGLVHSHPPGMGPSMSGVDVTAIQRRAEDSECYSLIISASRSADSNRMFMHYCVKIGGKTLIFRDMPVKIGWNGDRLSEAEDWSKKIIKELVGKDATKADEAAVRDAMNHAMCTMIPTTFSAERTELRKAIAAEVKEKVSKPQRASYGGSTMVWQGKPLGGPASSHNGSWRDPQGRKDNGIEYREIKELDHEWEVAQRLYSIGYDEEDPGSPEDRPITKAEAKRARKMHKKCMIALNTRLREIGGVGMGDLVMVNSLGVENNPTTSDLALEPTEVDDFQIKNGLISYIVGGEILWADELDLVTKYETIMDWDHEETKVGA